MNPDIQPHELSDMRQAADKASFDIQQKFHALLDAYEDQEENASEFEALRDKLTSAEDELKVVSEDQPEFEEEPLSDDAWLEALEDCKTPGERAEMKEEELTRARAAEAKLLERVEELTNAVEAALKHLKS